MNDTKISIGKLLRADNSQFVAGCRVSELDAPAFGALVRVNLSEKIDIYGLISNISIADDGLVRQLVSGVSLPPEYTADNRYNRNLPVEISVLTVGYREEQAIYHLLPPRPPLSLDTIYLCSPAEMVSFTSSGCFGYFRHILRAFTLPVSELLAAHLKQAHAAHLTQGDPHWRTSAARELITLLRDDHTTLTNVLGALANIDPDWAA
jgi:hypothetical protein